MSQRRREIGVRIAVGADSSQVRFMVLRHAMILANGGMGVGVVAAWGLTGFMTSILYGAEAAESLLASYLPARRAARTDLMVALRSE